MTGPRPAPLSLWRTLVLAVRRRWRGSGFWFGLAIALLWVPTMLCNRITFRGGEHVPRSGGVLLACNHVSFCDPIFDVGFTICHGRMPRFLAKAELWNVPVVRNVLAGGKHIPVHRASTRATDAYREAIAALQRGEVVAFYPEGTYTADPDGWPMKAKNGIGKIALVTGVPVIPVANWGTQDVLPPDTSRLRLFRRVTVMAGPPVDLSPWLGGPRTRTALDGATAAIMSDVTALVAVVRDEAVPQRAPIDPDARQEPPAVA
ncbi:lysophospholipid acyltransferase family protein [Pseudonocardia sp.]|uniref:lysophospholipid acyltransferase family protein n=1 Tax=Pseudonocardia sp. TaxID=60912 RepID=UPI003D13DD75